MAVKLFGHTVSTPAAVAIAGGSGLAIWFAYKQHKAAASTSATSPTAIDPVTGLPYSQDDQVDPLTGMTYLAEAQEYGSVSAAEQAAAGESGDDLTSEYGTSGSGLSDISGSGDTSLEAVPGGYTSNAQWAQAVTAGLSDVGYSAADVAAALGLYLGSLPLSTLADGVSSAQIVQAALAEYGPPPVGTFTMIAASGTGSGSTGSGSGSGSGGTGGTGSGSGTGTPPPVVTPPPTTKPKLKGIVLNQPHAISNAQGTYLFQHPGNGGVYWKADDGSYVETSTGQGVGQLYTGADGWAYLQKKGKA